MRMMMFLSASFVSCSSCVTAEKKKKASEDFYDFSAWMKDLERICITIFITN